MGSNPLWFVFFGRWMNFHMLEASTVQNKINACKKRFEPLVSLFIFISLFFSIHHSIFSHDFSNERLFIIFVLRVDSVGHHIWGESLLQQSWLTNWMLLLLQVEHIIREENMMAAQEILELFCELVVVRLPIIEAQKFVPLPALHFTTPKCRCSGSGQFI
jgi:hypothetical protein